MKQSTSTQFLIIVSIIGFMLAVGLMLLFTAYLFRPESAQGGSFPGSVAQIGINNRSASTTSQTPAVHVPTSIFATSTCSARIVTTTGGDITLSFHDGFVLGQYSGHLQLASTTEIYDGEQYGCGLMRVFAVSSTTITATETH